MRIAHLIIAHKNPEQLLRLLKRLKHVNSGLFVHLDSKVSIDKFRFLENEVNCTFIKRRIKCHWGGNSVLMSIINSVKEILDANEKYDYINLISGQDYPLMDSNRMIAFFHKNIGSNYIAFDQTFQSEWWQLARNRYEQYHFTDLNFKGRYLLQNIVNAILPKRKFHHFNNLYGGSSSSWWTITSECATYLVNVIEQTRNLKKFLTYTWCSDEFIVTTIIMNSRFRSSVVNNNLRYIDWSEGKARPKILTIRDLDSIEASNMMFARKFDVDVDTSILDILDSRIENK
jgi:hypothetical protein